MLWSLEQKICNTIISMWTEIPWGSYDPSHLCVYKQGHLWACSEISTCILLLNLEQQKYVTIWNKATTTQYLMSVIHSTIQQRTCGIARLRMRQTQHLQYISFHFTGAVTIASRALLDWHYFSFVWKFCEDISFWRRTALHFVYSLGGTNLVKFESRLVFHICTPFWERQTFMKNGNFKHSFQHY